MSKLVRDVMKTEVTTVSPDMSLPDLERVFVRNRFGALPVLDRDHQLQGIVSRADVVRKFSLEQSLAELTDGDFDAILGVEDDDSAMDSIGAEVGRRLAKMHARDIMITEVITVGPDEPLAKAAAMMLERRIHRLPVLEDGRLIGVVSAFDFMALYAEEAS